MGPTKDSVWVPTEDLGPRNEELRSLLEPFAPGQAVGRYRILRKLGEGGMGQVYLADDSNLGRRVALKVLKPEYRRHWSRLQRFEREAKAIAALSHPNIVTLYADETVDNIYFLVMEYVSGKKLTDVIPKRGVNLDRLFDIGIQLTDALAAAHARGITHRDLKPSNIIIGKDGNLKVLDFGLAKLREPEPEEDDSKASTEFLTQEGGLLGTVPYMSPEQVQGMPADERSDIFSCGVILYQLAIGKRPFDGDSSADLMSSIIRDDPPSVDTQRAGLPHHLSRIIKRALEKDPEHRYQSAKDLRNSLDDLRQELLSGESDNQPVPRSRPRPPKSVVVLAAVLAATLGMLTWEMLREDGVQPFPQARSFQVTSAPGWESDIAISPDGKLLAYASNESGSSDIWLVDAFGGTPIQLTRDPAIDRRPTWFPDGTAIAFESDRGGQSAIWKVPRLGGSPTMVLAEAQDPDISPDGRQIAFSYSSAGGDSRIGVASIDQPGGEIRVLTGQEHGLWGHRNAAWSPDGRRICYAGFQDLWLVPLDGGTPRRLTTAGGSDRHPVWSPDGQFIYFSSHRDATLAIWRVRVSSGETERLTMGSGPESQPSISADGTRLAYTTFDDDLDIILHNLRSGKETRVPGTRSEWGATLAPDGSELVYVSQSVLWRQGVEDSRARGEPARLTAENVDASNPDFAPDGSLIAYQRRTGNTRNIWVLPASGGVPEPFTVGEGVRFQPAWSPDGSEIAFVSEAGKEASGLWVAGFRRGHTAIDARKVETGLRTIYWPDWSPDGTTIAYLGSVAGEWDVWVARSDNSEPPRQLTRGAGADYLSWDSASGDLFVSGRWGNGDLTLRRVDRLTGSSLPLDPPVNFGSAQRTELSLSADGALLSFTRETVRGDLWLLEAQEGTF